MRLPRLLLAVIAAASLAGPLVAHLSGADPAAVDLLDRFAGPSAAHPLGTDELGRDMLLRLLEGGRVSLTIGIAAAIATAAIGTAVGPRRRISRRVDRPRADAYRRRGYCLAAPAAADRSRRARSQQGRRAACNRRVAGDQPHSHCRARGAGRLDNRCAAGARRDAGDAQPRFRARGPKSRCRGSAYPLAAHPAQRDGAAGGGDDAFRRRHHLAGVGAELSRASASSRRSPAGAACCRTPRS